MTEMLLRTYETARQCASETNINNQSRRIAAPMIFRQPLAQQVVPTTLTASFPPITTSCVRATYVDCHDCGTSDDSTSQYAACITSFTLIVIRNALTHWLTTRGLRTDDALTRAPR
jgi:hypothetical protein